MARQSLGRVLIVISMNLRLIVWVSSPPEDILTHLFCTAVILYLEAKGSLSLNAKFSLGNIIESLQCTSNPGMLPLKPGIYAWKTANAIKSR